MKDLICLLFSIALVGLVAAGCSKTEAPADEPAVTIEVFRPSQGLSLAYRVPVGENSVQEARARRSELMGRWNEDAMYAALSGAVGVDVRDKVEIERMEAIDTEYRLSLSTVLGTSDRDRFLCPESAGECLDVVVTRIYTLHLAVVRPLPGLSDEEKQKIETAIEPLRLYYLCASVEGEPKVFSCLIGIDDDALRIAAMEIVVADGRLGAVTEKEMRESR